MSIEHQSKTQFTTDISQQAEPFELMKGRTAPTAAVNPEAIEILAGFAVLLNNNTKVSDKTWIGRLNDVMDE